MVGVAGHEVALHHLVAQGDALFKRLQRFEALLLEADGDEHVEVQAQLLRVEQRHVLDQLGCV